MKTQPSLTSARSSNRHFVLFDLGNGLNTIARLLHVFLGEVAKAGVLRAGDQLVIRGLPAVSLALGEHLLKVVLDNH